MIYLEQNPVILGMKLVSADNFYDLQCYDAEIVLHDWTIQDENRDEIALTHPELIFKFDDAGADTDFPYKAGKGNREVWGYVLSDRNGRIFYWERFNGAPFVIPPAGGTVNITPKLNLPKLPIGLYMFKQISIPGRS